MTIQEWLDTPPAPEDLREKDGALYIPYHIVVAKLNKLCFELSHDGFWHTRDFSHLYYTLKNGKTIVSGNINLIVTYHQRKRWLSGAATFALSKSSNPHPAASVKSLAIMNAAKPLGKQFGWGLNGFENESVYFPEEEIDEKLKLSEYISQSESIEGLSQFKDVATKNGLMKVYMDKANELTNKIGKP